MNKSRKLKDVPSDERFQATNWKQLSKKEFQKLTPIQKSRYLAYEPSPDQNGINKSRGRLQDDYKKIKAVEKGDNIKKIELEEHHRQEVIVGQLKASEARNRVRSLRRHYHANRATEISHLISTQPTAIKAVRLQSLLPPIPTKIKFTDTVVKEQRMRIEALMEDELGIETGRILC